MRFHPTSKRNIFCDAAVKEIFVRDECTARVASRQLPFISRTKAFSGIEQHAEWEIASIATSHNLLLSFLLIPISWLVLNYIIKAIISNWNQSVTARTTTDHLQRLNNFMIEYVSIRTNGFGERYLSQLLQPQYLAYIRFYGPERIKG